MTNQDGLLLTPGPVPLSRAVRRAMDKPMVSHRSRAFEETYARVQEGLAYVFEHSIPTGSRTSSGGTALALNGTATMGMEAAVANLVDGDDTVVSLVNGKFGRRFARIADRHANCTRVSVSWGESFDVPAVADAVGGADLVTMVQNETSTGLYNPVETVGGLLEPETHFVVDGVTAIGGDEFRVDDWNVDIAVTDAQKCLGAPPGISALYVTDDVKPAIDGESAPFYEDVDWHLRKAESDQTPFTSAVPLFRAMAVALAEIREEGMPTRIERHRRQAEAFRAGFEAMGLALFPAATGPSRLSNTVTAVSLPASLRGEASEAFFAAVEERSVTISGGQAHLAGEIFRVANMGHFAGDEIVRGVRTIGRALHDVGIEVDVSGGVAQTRDALG